ncbi:MAG: ATP-binding protein [Chloroflexota bacterium]
MNQPVVTTVVVRGKYKNLSVIGAHVRSFLKENEITDVNTSTGNVSICFDIELAVHEICNNIIEHAYGHQGAQIRLRFSYDAQKKCIVIDLYDSGKQFDSSSVVQPDLDEPREEGYGLFLVNQLMDEVIYRPLTDGNHWKVIKYIT